MLGRSEVGHTSSTAVWAARSERCVDLRPRPGVEPVCAGHRDSRKRRVACMKKPTVGAISSGVPASTVIPTVVSSEGQDALPVLALLPHPEVTTEELAAFLPRFGFVPGDH